MTEATVIDSLDVTEPSAEPTGAPNARGRNAGGQFVKGHDLSRSTQFVVGNFEAVEHGLNSDRLPLELRHVETEVEAFIANALVDEGDSSQVSTRRRSLLNYRARLHRRIVQLDSALELRGLIDRRGKLRASWLATLQGLITTAKAVDTLLGLDRRAKTIKTSLAAFLEAAAADDDDQQDERDDPGVAAVVPPDVPPIDATATEPTSVEPASV